MYVTAGLGFAPAVVNTFGQLGLDLLCIGWKCAAKAAQTDLQVLSSLQESQGESAPSQGQDPALPVAAAAAAFLGSLVVLRD